MSRTLASALAFTLACTAGVHTAEAQRSQGNARQQYTVVSSEETFVLVDQRSGRTWLLAHSPAGGTPAWIPIERIDDAEEAEQWRMEQHELAEHREREQREHQQREMRERLEQRRREMSERREEFEQRARRERDERMRNERQRDERERDEQQRREREERQGRNRSQTHTEEPSASGVRERLQQLGEQTRRGMVESLEKHRQRLIEQFGEDHPAVKAISEQIERLSGKLQQEWEDAEQPREDAKSDVSPERPPQPPLKKKAAQQVENTKHPAAEDSIKRILAQVRKLQLDKELLLENNGPDHPRVREVQLKIEVTNRVFNELVSAELRPLLLEEQLLLESHGPKHPKVQKVRKEIELTRKFLEELRDQREARAVRKAGQPPRSGDDRDDLDEADMPSASDNTAPVENQ